MTESEGRTAPTGEKPYATNGAPNGAVKHVAAINEKPCPANAGLTGVVKYRVSSAQVTEADVDYAVEVQDAVVLLDRFPALAGLSLKLPTGSVTLVQGPNGAGKTTLLRMLAGLAPLERGSATVLGHDVATEPRQVRALVGLLSPQTMLYDDLTIAENLSFWSTLAGHGDIDFMAALERVSMAPFADQQVVTLSTGQRRRAAIAVVAIRRPRLWLLDEPHAGLDQAGRDIVDGLIADAVAAGATVIVASHELDRVRPLATHVATVAGGVVHSFETIKKAGKAGQAGGADESDGASGACSA